MSRANFSLCFQSVVKVGAVMKPALFSEPLEVKYVFLYLGPFTDGVGTELFSNMCWVQLGVV
jgi:hypothetical protein